MKTLYSSEISWENEIVKFGIGLFETMAFRNNNILFLDEHINRLTKSSLELKIGENHIESATRQLKKSTKTLNKTKAIRLTLSNSGYAIEERDIPYDISHYKIGFKLWVYPYKRGENPYYRYKTTSYMENYYARNTAKSKGFDDAVFIDYENHILECSSSNIIFRKDNTFILPSFSKPILKGIAVTKVIEELNKDFKIIEKNISMNDIKVMDEAYVCNSLLGIMPVSSIESKDFSFDFSLSIKINNKIFQI